MWLYLLLNSVKKTTRVSYFMCSGPITVACSIDSVGGEIIYAAPDCGTVGCVNGGRM